MADSEHQFEAAFLKSVLEAVPAFVVLLDDDDRITYINRLQPGFVRSEVIGRSTYDFVAPEYHQRHREAILAVRNHGGSEGFLTRSRTADGAPTFYDSRVIGVTGSDGRRSVFVIALEVTEHVARADLLTQSEENLRMAVEAAGIGLWSWDFATGAVEWNARMHEITGSPVSLAGPAYVERCVHPEDRGKMREESASVLTGVAHYPVHRVVRSDGEVRWIAPVGTIDVDEHGKPVRMRGGIVDVTNQRHTEEHLRQRQKLDAVGSLTAGVAHNFNNVLAVILPAIETALAEPALAGAPSARRLLREAAAASRRATDLVARLMSLAGQRQAAAHEAIDLAELLGGVVSMCRQTFDRRYVLELVVDGQPPLIRGDSAAIEQVFLNLLLNARDAIEVAHVGAPKIVVELGTKVDLDEPREVTHARVTVTDNGAGMSASTKARLFEPFFSTKAPGHGTGLGLATTRSTLEEHGGHIEISSDPGKGTRCEVLLPMLSGLLPEAVELCRAPAIDRARILVVDDEPAVRSVLGAVFESDGHETHQAECAASAIAAIDAGFRPDFVLLDRSMPGWPAARAVAELRVRLGAVPIVFFTGQDVPREEAALVDDVLLKPLSVDALQALTRRWLSKT